MTDIVSHRPSESPAIARRLRRFPARLARALDRALFAHRIRDDIGELSDRLRRDVGLTHG